MKALARRLLTRRLYDEGRFDGMIALGGHYGGPIFGA